MLFCAAGSNDEVFFDSQAWLDSDYEDEFMSVNGGKRHCYFCVLDHLTKSEPETKQLLVVWGSY